MNEEITILVYKIYLYSLLSRKDQNCWKWEKETEMKDIAFLVNTPTLDQSLLYSLEWVAGGIDLHVNADKIDFICFIQRADISTQNGKSLKLVDKFTCLVSSISSTKNDVHMCLMKAWTAIDRLLVI